MIGDKRKSSIPNRNYETPYKTLCAVLCASWGVGGEMAKEAKYYLELTQDNWDFTMGLPTNDNVLRY